MGKLSAAMLSFRMPFTKMLGLLMILWILFTILQNKYFLQATKLMFLLPPLSSNVTNTSANLVEVDITNPLSLEYHINTTASACFAQPYNTSVLFTCNWTKTPMNICDQRLCASISCARPIPDIIFQVVNNSTQPMQYEYNDTCLDAVIKRKCHNGTNIPKIVHFVNFGRHEFPYYGMLSVISAFRFVQPCLILIHGDYLPFGRYWDLVVTKVPTLLFIHRQQPTSIFGHEIHVVEHSADIARLEAIRRFGGIYMDIDHVIINPLDKLLNYSVVMSVETEGLAIGNGMFLGKPGAKFLDIWYDSYQSFNDKEWGSHSVIMPFNLNKIFSQMGLHLEINMFKPYDRIQIYEMYTKHYDWTILYGIHLYARISKEYLNEKLETFNSSMGEIVRRILYGNHTSCL